MDEITFIRKNDDDGDELACEDCYFHDLCSVGYGDPFLDCNAGDYWEIKK